MVDLGTSLLQWLNRNDLHQPCSNLSDLSDGILLYELLNRVSPEYFDMECISIDVKNNWALKLGNLRRLKKALDKYLEEELKISNTRFDRIDLPNLARKANHDDIIKLFEGIFYAIVNCPQKNVFIKRIMELEESMQVQMMFFIQKIIGEDEENPIQDSELFKKELERLKNEKKKLSNQVLELEQELASATEEKNRLVGANQQLKAENERLYNDIDRKSSKEEKHLPALVNDLRSRIQEKDEMMAEMQRSIDKMKKHYEIEIAQLKDDLDIATAKIYQNMSADKTLQQYKKRLESLAGIKQKAMDLQKQNENLMETVNSQHIEIESLSGLKRQVSGLKENILKEKSRADTLSFNLENKEKIIKKYEKEIKDYRQRISLLESKNHELADKQESGSEDSFVIQGEKDSLKSRAPFPKDLPSKKPRQSCLPTSHEQLEFALTELTSNKTQLDAKKIEIKSYRERLQMAIEEMNARTFEYFGVIRLLESNNLILSDEIQVMNDKLAERDNEKVVHEQTMYELEEVKASKVSLLNDIKTLYSEKDVLHKKYLDCREEFFVVQSQLNAKDLKIRETELECRVLMDKIVGFEDKEKVFILEIASLRRNSLVEGGTQEVAEYERSIIALKNEISELQYRLEEKNARVSEVLASKEEATRKLQKEIEEIEERHSQELEIKTQEFMAQSEEATKELLKQREQLVAKLQFERRNTMMGLQRAMSIRDPSVFVTDEIFKLRETLLEKEKEIARVSKNNKELKMCWKDSAKLLKAVWKQLGDETKKIEEAVRKRNG